jgi:monovalent cation:H+ antiporter, CPA1 family
VACTAESNGAASSGVAIRDLIGTPPWSKVHGSITPSVVSSERMTWPAALVLLLVVATIVSYVARRLRVPYTVALVVAGLGLSATHAFIVPTLTREMMFGVVLPALIFEAAFDLEIEEVRHDAITLAALAVPGVVAAIVITAFALGPTLETFGVPTDMIPDRSGAVVFASLISATDPVAVVALFRALEAPRRLQVIVEGESLLNDGTAIIFFTLALAHAGAYSPGGIVVDFIYIMTTSVIVGVAIGGACAVAMRRLSEPRIEVLLTTVAAYGSFFAAQSASASGVIATVTAGLMCGGRGGRGGLSAAARISATTFWDYLAFVLNSFVFLSIGLMVKLPALLASWRLIVVAFLIVTVSRVLMAWAIAGLLPKRLELPRRWTAILSWGGLRGALSMVLALSIPETFPQRDLLIAMTFGVVVLSILIQGISVGPTLRWLGLRRGRGEHSGYLGTQLALLSAHSSLEDVERTGAMVAAHEGIHRSLAEEYDDRLDRAEHALIWLVTQLGGGDASAHAARHLLATTERERITEAFKAGAIDEPQRERWLDELRARWSDDGDAAGGR